MILTGGSIVKSVTDIDIINQFTTATLDPEALGDQLAKTS